MKRFIPLFFLTVVLYFNPYAQNSSLIVLGDIHYDLLDDHEMDWLKKKPDDLRQVTEEYTVYTKKNWTDFTAIIKNKATSEVPPVKAVIQLGDLSEGLAGSEDKAFQMASHTMKAIDETEMPVPWIIARGNHDITGPGAEQAFKEYYVPMFRKQTGNSKINNASYSYSYDNVQITCIDPWDKETDLIRFLEKELTASKAKYKFIAVHEPVIPVTERCWHTLRKEPGKREKLLEIIASHKAIVLCGHLHRYSVVRRETDYGPVVQVMVISVVKDRNYQEPENTVTTYGPSLAENVPEWQPETLNERKAILAGEEKFITYYKQTDLPGYAVINIREKEKSILLKYYAAFGEEPYDIVDLTKLLNL